MKKTISLLFAFLFVLFCVTALADNEAVTSAEAKSMRLKEIQGEILLTESDGKPVSVRVNMRLYNGNNIQTGKDSIAAIQLDEAKAVTLAEISNADIIKKKKNLEIQLKSGDLYFNVTKPLEANESFQISTSTMVLGIRGTSGIVEVISDAETDVTLITGHAQITAWNGDVIEIEAGQRIRIIKTGEESGEFQTTAYSESEESEWMQKFTFEEKEHGLIREEMEKLETDTSQKTIHERTSGSKPKESETPSAPAATKNPNSIIGQTP